MAENLMGKEPELGEVKDYFISLGFKVRKGLMMHKEVGLWDRTPEHKMDWGNVSEHCLVEAARVEVFSDIFGFSGDLKSDLIIAAALHDFDKKIEKNYVKEHGDTITSYDEATEIALQILRDAGFSDRVVRLVDAAGSETADLQESERLVSKENLIDEDIAYLIMHYVDDYTFDSNWVSPSGEVDGRRISDLDRRIGKTALRYPELKAQGFFDIQTRVGLLVENKIGELLSQRKGEVIDPKQLPEIVDLEIKERIWKKSHGL